MNELIIRLRQHVARIVHRHPVLGRPEVSRKTMRLGAGINAWTIDPTLVDAQSVVYSFGVGEDVGLDVGLVKTFGVTVHAFDPTPKSIAWFKGHNPPLPPQLVLHEYGAAAHDGTIEFSAPKNPDHFSHTVLQGVMDDSHRFSVPVKRLSTVMTELGHAKIDLLKMDIEGAEYDVLADMVASKIFPTQVLVEFHHRFPTVSDAMTTGAIDLLRGAGYKIFAVSASAEEFSFVRV